jgi:hypothetical protein
MHALQEQSRRGAVANTIGHKSFAQSSMPKTIAGEQRGSQAKGRHGEAMMAGEASPPRRASSANTLFLDEIDDPHGDAL